MSNYAADSRYEIDNRVAGPKPPTPDDLLTGGKAQAPGASGVHIMAARRIGKSPEELARRVGIPVAEMTSGERVCAFIEEYCMVPEGEFVGQPMRLAPFQIGFILDIYDNPHGTSKAILSMARKNGKTALIAAMLLAHIAGPLAHQNAQIVSGALSREQAAMVFNLAAKMVAMSPILKGLVFPVPSTKSLTGMAENTNYKAVSAEATTAHGMSPILVLLDEAGQIKGPKSAFVEALESSQGAYKNPLFIVISTQAATDGDLFSRLIDDALLTQDPHVVCHVYAADPEADLMDEAAWAVANPGLDVIRQRGSLKQAAERAVRMPAEEAGFRQLFLNQRVEAKSPYVSRSVWLDNGGDPDLTSDLTWYGGLDLSATVDLTAFVMVGQRDDIPEGEADIRSVDCRFWCPEDGIHERSARDRVPYGQWWKDGYITAMPGATVDYDYVAFQVIEVMKVRRFAKVAFDRWNFTTFAAALLRNGLPQNEIDAIFVPYGQGFVTMSPALRVLDEVLLNRRLRHGNQPVLAMCARNAIVLQDPAGNRKLSKTTRDHRIDGMIALAMAVGVGGANPAAATFDASAMIG